MTEPLPRALQEIADEIARQRGLLVADLRGLDQSETVRSPGEEEWNAAQIVDHLLLAEGFTNDITTMLVDQAVAAGKANGFPDIESLARPGNPVSLEAPPPIRPQKQLPPDELIAELEGMSERTEQSFRKLAGVDPRTLKMPHPLFGELDLGQWWHVIAIHYDMHLRQARSALKAVQA